MDVEATSVGILYKYELLVVLELVAYMAIALTSRSRLFLEGGYFV